MTKVVWLWTIQYIQLSQEIQILTTGVLHISELKWLPWRAYKLSQIIISVKTHRNTTLLCFARASKKSFQLQNTQNIFIYILQNGDSPIVLDSPKPNHFCHFSRKLTA